jgi:hypothetical protein
MTILFFSFVIDVLALAIEFAEVTTDLLAESVERQGQL